jgi:hypothetical protein
VVPEYEEREAARFVGVSWETYVGWPREERARTVAQHRLSALIELNVGDAMRQEMERETRRRRR